MRASHLLARLRTGGLWALGGGVLIAVGGRLAARPEWPLVLLGWVALALIVALLLALRRWPSGWAVAVAADGLGLAERVASALYAARASHPAASLVEADAARALARLDPAGYPIFPKPLRRYEVATALALAVALVVPIPTLGDSGRQASEARSIAAARQSVQALESKLKAQPEPLARSAASELEATEERLAEARSALEAARILEQAQERLAGQGRPEDYAWERALEGLGSTWAQSPHMAEAARSIGEGDREGVEDALADLAGRVEGMPAEDRGALQQALQAGANAARDVPGLSGALRQAASELSKVESGEGGQGSAGKSLREAASQIGEGMSRSAGLRAAQQAVAGLGQARAGLGRVAGAASGASGTAAGGASSGGASGGEGAGGSGSGSGGGQGAGSGSGTGSGSGSGGSGGAGSGSGSGSGGAGGAGGGAGAGAGAGGGPSGGRPGGATAGATTAGGGAAPNVRGTVNYESVYAPSLMGGSGGPRVAAPGEALGTSGETVELPESPLEMGSIRPYNEVYGQYEEAARQSLSRQPLPPALQGIVQRYFSSIAPDK